VCQILHREFYYIFSVQVKKCVLLCNVNGVYVCDSAVTHAQRPAGCAVRAVLVVPTSAASRAVVLVDSSRPTYTANDTSTRARTATALDINGQSLGRRSSGYGCMG